ncbi:restriction endonuclease subunit S [Streptomyces albidoflavus]|uniref:restriction endonuclease subunit S n=1 Tax=Streptomyces TaxID=1883 RepID=UPI00224F27C8|nr:restriction endonuclease subunit S [Streptomyces albidoflavus]MCX4441334.1 restriction endonuclease subunit S [Streptomyces albidoflavus]WTB76828.1 restriction endonuclease subunit S [Streptomyces albidoflavus]
MTDWELTRLGDVTSQIQDVVKVTPGEEYPLLGVKWYAEGPFVREVVTSESSKASRFYRVSAEQFIYNRLFAWKGSFGLVGADMEGFYVSNEFPLFECDRSRLLPEFLSLHFQQRSVWGEVERLSTGTTASRNRWKESQFANYRLPIPPTPDQRRIVDVMGAVDAQIGALDAEKRRASSLLKLVRNAFPEGTECALSSVVSRIQGGKSVQTSDEKPQSGEPAVLKLNAIQLGTFLASEAKRLDDLTGYTEAHRVAEGDLLITRASGSFDRVGYAAIARNVAPETYLPDLIWRIQTNPKVCSATFLAHLLCSPSVRSMITASARGTASMRKINKALLGSLRLSIPSLQEQSTYVQNCDAVASAVDALDIELAGLHAFRSALLAALLNQELEIPESYDALLEEVS